MTGVKLWTQLSFLNAFCDLLWMWHGEDGFSFGAKFLPKTIPVSPTNYQSIILQGATKVSMINMIIIVVTFTVVDDHEQFHRQLHVLRRCCFSLVRRSERCGRMRFGEVLPICYWKCWARSRTSCPIGGDIQTTTDPYTKRRGRGCVRNKHVRCSFLWQNPCCAFVLKQRHAIFVASGTNKSEQHVCFFSVLCPMALFVFNSGFASSNMPDGIIADSPYVCAFSGKNTIQMGRASSPPTWSTCFFPQIVGPFTCVVNVQTKTFTCVNGVIPLQVENELKNNTLGGTPHPPNYPCNIYTYIDPHLP